MVRAACLVLCGTSMVRAGCGTSMVRAACLVLAAVQAVAHAAPAPAPGTGTLFGLTMIENSPSKGSMCSIDPATGNVTLIGGTLAALSGTDDCRAIDSKRGLYYYLGDTHQGTTLVGLSLHDASVKCSSTVPLKEIGFVGIGQGLKYDKTRDRLILVGLVANETGGVSHQVLTADLSDSSDGAATEPASCARFTKAGTFPLADSAPMLHSTAYDEASQTLYTTIIPAKGQFGLAVVDLVKQQMVRVELEGNPPIDEMSGMSWDIDTASLIGMAQNGHSISLLSLDPQGPGKWTSRELIAPPKCVSTRPPYAIGGNEGDVHSYDPTTGIWYAVLTDPPDPKIPPVIRLGVIDWTSGALLSANVLTWPKINGASDKYKLLWQMELGP